MTTLGLIAHYPLDANATDASGHVHHGVVHGAKPTANRFGEADTALEFDGVDDYVEVAPPPAIRETCTLSLWARYAPRDLEGYTNCIIAQDDGNDEDQSRRVFQLSTEHGHVIWHRMIGARDPMCKARVQFGQWYHVAAVVENNVHRLYVDGALADEVRHPFWTHPEQPLHIGRKGTDEPYFFFKGAIDDVRLYDRALSPAEIDALTRERGWTPPAIPALPADPVSGRWGKDGVVFLHLRYDGDHGVTGRIMGGEPHNMAPVERGTFDRASGAIRLTGQALDLRANIERDYVIEGFADGEAICVLARFGDFSGNFMLTKQGAALRVDPRSIRSQLGAFAFDLFG
ncbi:MAG TPA: LamG domain-containing protein [Gemmatimonadaceae bacterium]|nr:LamG domain-containing protein [Gemmatimonadaceae bacterium]